MQRISAGGPFRVAIGMNFSVWTAQCELRGILRFARVRPDWRPLLLLTRADGPRRVDLARLGMDGAIADSSRPDLAAMARRRGVPLVRRMPFPEGAGAVATFYSDDDSIARLAGEHLLSRGFRHFAFVGEASGIAWSRRRRAAFRRELAGRGLSCDVYPTLPPDRRADFAFARKNLSDWLARLPRPVGVFAAYDVRALDVLNACREAGIAVPDEVSVVGVDDDPLLCETSDPALTSVSLGTEQAGYEAAQALDEAMRGGRVRGRRIVFGGVRVVERASTARFVGRDPLVARVRALVAAGVSGRLAVSDLARTLGVSRRTLELRFRAETGGPVGGAILAARLDRAKELLRTTSLPCEEIAAACGICSASHMGSLFRRRFGASPSRFRDRGGHFASKADGSWSRPYL